MKIFFIIYLTIGVILECIAMFFHKKIEGTFYFDWEPIYVKFAEGVISWPLIFPKCLINFLKWKKKK
jgi:hypothetical protein